MIIRALRSLAADSWVLGIAAAAALAYATVKLAEGLVSFSLQFGEGVRVADYPRGEGFDPPYSLVAFGRWIFYGEFLSSAVLFVVTLALVAAVVHVTRPAEDEQAAD